MVEKGFRTLQCPGCPVKLRIPVSEEDYGKTKVVRCPKCGARGRVTIPHPAPESIAADKNRTAPGPSFEELFGDILKKE